MRSIVLAVSALLSLSCATQRASVFATGPKWLTEPPAPPSLKGKHVVFVAGHLNEFIPGYFDDNAAVVKELGATSEVVRPPSPGTMDADVFLVTGATESHHEGGVILFGHSRGGASSLLTVLRRPRLILDGHVAAVIIVQGAVGGSPLADFINKVKPLRSEGIKALTTEESERTLNAALTELSKTLSPEEWDRVFSRIFYVRSGRMKDVPAAELAFTELLLRDAGTNDGLLVTHRQGMAFGTDLGVIDADHASLVVTGMLSVTSVEERRAFTSALLGEVARRLNW
ncbi:MAG: hypothetical protein QM817_07080 [Archangium sp.]